MKRKSAMVTKSIDLILTQKWERRVVMSYSAGSGQLVLTKTERYPLFIASDHWRNKQSGEVMWGIAVKKTRTSPPLALTCEGKPLVYGSKEIAEKLASWMNDPKGTQEEWATDHTAASAAVKVKR